MRISDWSSDVCSADLEAKARLHRRHAALRNGGDGTAPEPFTTARGHCDLRPSPDQSTGGNRLPMSAHGAHPKGSGMRLRSLLFVPGDQPERFEKAAASGTDAVILDLEDSVSPANKAKARTDRKSTRLNSST